MNFQTLLKELQAMGYSQAEIARRCLCARSTINELASGKTKAPSFMTAVAIKDVHSKAIRAQKRKEKSA